MPINVFQTTKNRFYFHTKYQLLCVCVCVQRRSHVNRDVVWCWIFYPVELMSRYHRCHLQCLFLVVISRYNIDDTHCCWRISRRVENIVLLFTANKLQ